jgi:hypothetical protein
MSNIKRRVKWNKHGVSEIIGNILILGITVTLFSSIMCDADSARARLCGYDLQRKYGLLAINWWMG